MSREKTVGETAGWGFSLFLVLIRHNRRLGRTTSIKHGKAAADFAHDEKAALVFTKSKKPNVTCKAVHYYHETEKPVYSENRPPGGSSEGRMKCFRCF